MNKQATDSVKEIVEGVPDRLLRVEMQVSSSAERISSHAEQLKTITTTKSVGFWETEHAGTVLRMGIIIIVGLLGLAGFQAGVEL